MTEHCPTCREPVLLTPDGRALEPEPHRLGINLPDGGMLTPAQIADGETLGHRRHMCPEPEQMGLFGGEGA